MNHEGFWPEPCDVMETGRYPEDTRQGLTCGGATTSELPSPQLLQG